MFKGRGIIVFTILFLIFSFSNNVFSENIKIQSASGTSGSHGLNAGEVSVSRGPANTIDVGQESITLKGAGAEGIETGTLGNPASGPEQANIDLDGTPYSGKHNRHYEGITISRVTDHVNSSVVKKKDPNKMKQVKNLGKPERVNAMARSVKAEVKYSDSPRMNKMQERKKNRRANMKKKLAEEGNISGQK